MSGTLLSMLFQQACRPTRMHHTLGCVVGCNTELLLTAVSEATTYRQVNDLVPGWLVILKVHDVWVIPAPAIRYESRANCAALDQPSRPQLKNVLQVRLEEIREAVTDPESVNVERSRHSGVQHDVQCQQQSTFIVCELCPLPKE